MVFETLGGGIFVGNRLEPGAASSAMLGIAFVLELAFGTFHLASLPKSGAQGFAGAPERER